MSEPEHPEVDPERGLSAEEVERRRSDGRTNVFSSPASRSLRSIVRANVLTRFNLIILLCFSVLLSIGRWQDALFGASAVLNALIGSVQEFRAKRALDRLSVTGRGVAHAIRDGREVEIEHDGIVLDDVLVVRAGDQVPADATVVSSDGMQVDESMLTGEADAVDKTPGSEILSGSIVTAGSATVRVTHVGADSYANRFAVEAKKFSLARSELRSSVNRVLTWSGWLIIPVSVLVLNAQMVALGGWPAATSSGRWTDAVVATIAAVVAMIPLGLVLMTSIAFAVGAVKLARFQVLVQELAAVEGLARVDSICLDKTGTLTFGEIVLDEVHPRAVEDAEGWRRVLAWYSRQPDANATAKSFADAFPDPDPLTASGTVPFSSARKWSSASFGEGAPGTWVLGGPEMVLFTGDAEGASTLADADRFAATGRRTLVLAHTPAGADGSLEPERIRAAGLRPVALITLRETIRPDARETLDYFARQGVRVRVISGDNPVTVAAIARQVGLEVDEGVDARTLPAEGPGFDAAVERGVVFGRVTPQQKRAMVTSLQRGGHVVAMTGDGVNDALAIKEADIGVAMNTGSPATKAVARLVLLDGRFAHLPRVVDEGRQVTANIERVSMLFFTKTAYASGLAIVFGVLLATFPFLPRQLAVTDGLTIGLPAFFLALLANATRYRAGFLRRSLSFAIPAGVVVTAALSLYAFAAASEGIGQTEIRTGATLVLAMVGLWILVVLSRPLSALKTLIIGVMMIALILVFAVPFARRFLDLTDVGLPGAILVFVTTVGAVCGIELARLLHRMLVRAWDARTTSRTARST